MPRNGSGSYTLPANTWNPATPETPILSEDWNQTADDLAQGLTQSLASDGQTTASARIPFAQGVSIATGLVGAPGLSIVGDADTGIYAPAANQLAFSAAGVQAILLTSTGVTFPLAVTFSGNQSVVGTFTVTGPTVLNGSTTIGDAGADALTVNATGTFAGNQTFSGTITANAAATFTGTVTVPDASFTNAKLANMTTQTIKGRTTAGSGAPEDLTATQATAILSVVVGDSGSGGTKGLVPAAAAGDAAKKLYLDAAGTYSNEMKAWGVFNGTTGATIASRNISCVRNSTGVYTFTFGTALANANYALFVASDAAASANGSYQPFISAKTSSGFSVNTVQNSGGSVASFDPDRINVQVIA